MPPRLLLLLLAVAPLAAGLAACRQASSAPEPADDLPPVPWVIAHRGAAAYAPENTIPAFELAAEQGAPFVELDLQRTRDGQLVALHDLTLERTTDAPTIFPGRNRPGPGEKGETHWWLEDFTLEELLRLDAGSWFDPKFSGTRIPTLDEVLEAIRGRAGLFIELKSPERYPGIEQEMMAVLARHRLDTTGADPRTPVMLQSFTVESIERLSAMGVRLPRHVLIAAADADAWLSDDGLTRISGFATGISPEKTTRVTHGAAWQRARAMGLRVTPWTFRASTVRGFPTVTEEMAHAIAAGADGVITDNPDLAPGLAGSR